GRGNGAGLPGKTRRFHDAPTDPELYQNIVTAQRVLATRAVRGPGQAAEMARLPVVLKNDLLIKVLQRHGPEFYTIFRLALRQVRPACCGRSPAHRQTRPPRF